MFSLKEAFKIHTINAQCATNFRHPCIGFLSNNSKFFNFSQSNDKRISDMSTFIDFVGFHKSHIVFILKHLANNNTFFICRY